MLTALVIVLALLVWALRLIERGFVGREGSLLLAGALVMIAAVAVLFVQLQLARLFSL
jgi:Zn-dependent protease with chaperone function